MLFIYILVLFCSFSLLLPSARSFEPAARVPRGQGKRPPVAGPSLSCGGGQKTSRTFDDGCHFNEAAAGQRGARSAAGLDECRGIKQARGSAGGL